MGQPEMIPKGYCGIVPRAAYSIGSNWATKPRRLLLGGLSARMAVGSALILIFSLAAAIPAAAPLRADLVVSKLSEAPSWKEPGGSFRMTATTKNRGPKRAEASTTRFYLSRAKVRNPHDIRLKGSDAVGRLRRNRKSSDVTRVKIPKGVSKRLYYVLACADDKKKVRESSESNNCRSTGMPMLVDKAPPEPNPLNVTTSLDDANAVTEMIDAEAGGDVTATADGSAFTLHVPPDSLLADTEITLSPIASVDGLPAGLTDPVGVHLAPEGTMFAAAATLTIDPVTPPAERLVVGAAGDGQDVHRYPHETEGSSSTMRIGHFSEYILLDGDASALDGTISVHPEFRVVDSMADLIQQWRDGEIDSDEFHERATPVMKNMYYYYVLPALQAAQGDADRAGGAIGTFFSWERQLHLLFGHADFQREIDDGHSRLPGIVKNAFDTHYQSCLDGDSPLWQAQQMTAWARFSDLRLAGASGVLGEDHMDKIAECSLGDTVFGTINFRQEIEYESANSSGHIEREVTLNVNYKRDCSIPSNCLWEDRGGTYSAKHTLHEESDTDCHSERDETGVDSGAFADQYVFDGFSFYPSVANHVSMTFSTYNTMPTEETWSHTNCDNPDNDGSGSSTGTDDVATSNCPRTTPPGWQTGAGMTGVYDADTHTIDMSCHDVYVESGGTTTTTTTVSGTLRVPLAAIESSSFRP